MTTQPSPSKLLARICDTLDDSVMADMGSPYARRQLKAGLWALRRLGESLHTRTERLQADVRDMQALLEHARAGAPAAGAAGDEDAESLEQRHLRLQGQIEALEAQAIAAQEDTGADVSEILRALRALYVRMLERDAAGPKESGGG